jgi:osmotically-inducible protein OsmY
VPRTVRRTRIVGALFAAVVLGSVLGCATPRTDAQKQADKELADRVDSALQADKLLYAKHITVHVDRGVAELSGYVWEAPDLTEAERVASGVDGVTSVLNDLELQRNGLGDSPVSR